MAKYPVGLREEELKLCVAEDWFAVYDCKRRIGNIDFCVELKATPLGIYGADGMLWAEAKAGTNKDILESFVQLILTIGRSRVTDEEHPPRFLGAFDAEKIAFLPYDSILDVLAQNDFNWNVTPSNHETYDIRKFFQGVKVDAKGKEKMNATSGDLRYNKLLADLKRAMKKLAAKIVPKVYEYGFLKR